MHRSTQVVGEGVDEGTMVNLHFSRAHINMHLPCNSVNARVRAGTLGWPLLSISRGACVCLCKELRNRKSSDCQSHLQEGTYIVSA